MPLKYNAFTGTFDIVNPSLAFGEDWQGPWSAVTSYTPNNVVSSGGLVYACHVANTNQEPPNGSYWAPISSAGPAGEKGDTGDTGSKGDTGDTGSKGDTGDTGDVGDTGDQGIQGIPGEDGQVTSVADRQGAVTLAQADITGLKVADSPTFVGVTLSGGVINGRTIADDGTKLDGIEVGANDYSHPANHPPSIITQDASNRFATDAEKSTWNSKQDALGFAPSDSADEGAANGIAQLGADNKLRTDQIPASMVGAVAYQGTWDADTNAPSLSDGSGAQGEYYRVSVAGSTTLDGVSDWEAGDWAIFNGTVWEKVDNTDQVTSVADKQGAVTLEQADITGLKVTDSPTFAGANSATSNVGGGSRTHIINGASVTSTSEVHTEGDTDLGGATNHRHSNSLAFGAHYMFLTSGGTHASPTGVVDGQTVGRLLFAGHDGTDYALAAEFRVVSDGTPGDDDMPARVDLMVTPQGSQTPVTVISFLPDGTVSMKGGDITNVRDIALDTISSASGGPVAVTLGTDPGDNFVVNGNKLVISGDKATSGLGVSSPLASWHVKDDVNAEVLIHTNKNNPSQAAVIFSTSVGSEDINKKGALFFTNNGLGNGIGDFTIALNTVVSEDNVTVADAKFRVFSTGDVVVGDTVANARFDVNNATDTLSLRVYRPGTTATDSIADFVSDGTAPNTTHCSILVNGNILNTNGVFGSISDRKHKENIVPATSKIDDFMRILFNSFNRIGSDLKQMGVISDELKKIFPGLVTSTPDMEDKPDPDWTPDPVKMGQVPVTETVTVYSSAVVFDEDSGRWVKEITSSKEERPLSVDYPLWNEDDSPVLDTKGKQKIHSVPRMEEGIITPAQVEADRPIISVWAGTYTESVKYSVLGGPITGKVVQEMYAILVAQGERITELEAGLAVRS